MKELFIKIFVVGGILLGTGFWVSWVHAADVQWRDFIIYTDYDESKQELEIKIWVDVADSTNDVFELEMDVDGETCRTDMEFSSGTYKVSGECIVDLKPDEVRGIYKLNATIVDEDDDTVFNGRIEFEVDGYWDDFNWNNLKTQAVFDEAKEELTLEVYMSNVSRLPDIEYELEIEFENKDYDKDLKYDEDEEELRAIFEIDVLKSAIEDDYRLDYRILDWSEEIDDGRLDIEIDVESSSDDFDWDDLGYSSEYDEERERLEIVFQLKNIKNEPKERYQIFLELEDEDYDQRFKYDSWDDLLEAKFSIKIQEEDVEDDYDIDFYVENDAGNRKLRDDVRLEIGESVVSSESSSGTSNVSESSNSSWSDLRVTLDYDENTQNLSVELELPNVSDYPSVDYFSRIDIDGVEVLNGRVIYRSAEKTIRWKFISSVKKADLQEAYTLWVQVEDEYKNLLYNTEKTYRVWEIASQTPSSTQASVNPPSNINTGEIAPEIVVAVDAYIARVSNNEDSLLDVTTTFRRTINLLNDYVVKQPKYKDIVRDINYLLEDAISSYKLLN